MTETPTPSSELTEGREDWGKLESYIRANRERLSRLDRDSIEGKVADYLGIMEEYLATRIDTTKAYLLTVSQIKRNEADEAERVLSGLDSWLGEVGIKVSNASPKESQ